MVPRPTSVCRPAFTLIELLVVIFADAKVIKTVKVGKSAVEGHFGHHDLSFDADKQFGVFTNPGDGTVCVLSLKTLEAYARDLRQCLVFLSQHWGGLVTLQQFAAIEATDVRAFMASRRADDIGGRAGLIGDWPEVPSGSGCVLSPMRRFLYCPSGT